MNSNIPRNGFLLEINLWNPHLDLKFLNCKLFIEKYGFYDWLNKCVFGVVQLDEVSYQMCPDYNVRTKFWYNEHRREVRERTHHKTKRTRFLSKV